MAKYRKRPIEIEAFQFKPEEFENGSFTLGAPDWFINSWTNGNIRYLVNSKLLQINTLESKKFLCEGNYWIIRGVNGEIYGCSPDIFEKTYDKVEDLE